ncbi:MAG: SGNH/GDSL hydrolase family protein [Marmoricola sp.]
MSSASAPASPSARFHRYVALGDSFTEGVGDVDPARPNAVRGWADRVAEAMAADAAAHGEPFGYANLAIRGRKMDKILAEQIEPALALEPDLVTIYSGVNDILRPRVDIDAIMSDYREARWRLRRAGIPVAVFTAFDPGTKGFFGPLRGRLAIYNEHVRELAEETKCVILDSWRMRPARPDTMWADDRIHLNAIGHQYVAIKVLETLGIPHDLVELEPEPRPTVSAAERRAANLEWLRKDALPFVNRRLRGRSSGDNMDPKFATYVANPGSTVELTVDA